VPEKYGDGETLFAFCDGTGYNAIGETIRKSQLSSFSETFAQVLQHAKDYVAETKQNEKKQEKKQGEIQKPTYANNDNEELEAQIWDKCMMLVPIVDGGMETWNLSYMRLAEENGGKGWRQKLKFCVEMASERNYGSYESSCLAQAVSTTIEVKNGEPSPLLQYCLFEMFVGLLRGYERAPQTWWAIASRLWVTNRVLMTSVLFGLRNYADATMILNFKLVPATADLSA